MKRYTILTGVVCSVLFLTLAGCSSVPQYIPGATTITVVNNTGYAIYHLYATPPTSSNWGEDLLNDLLDIGASSQITLPGSGDWDFMLVDNNGELYFKMKVRIARGSQLEFTHFDFGFPVEGSSGPAVFVMNRTGSVIEGLFISRKDDPTWERDLLVGDAFLDNEKMARISLTGAGIWDIKLVDGNGNSFIKYDCDISEDSRIDFTMDDLVDR
jgi:hypothetical protein